MALLTQRYKAEALSLADQGLSLSDVERELTKRHGCKVVDYRTIHLWLQQRKKEAAMPQSCCIQHG